MIVNKIYGIASIQVKKQQRGASTIEAEHMHESIYGRLNPGIVWHVENRIQWTVCEAHQASVLRPVIMTSKVATFGLDGQPPGQLHHTQLGRCRHELPVGVEFARKDDTEKESKYRDDKSPKLLDPKVTWVLFRYNYLVNYSGATIINPLHIFVGFYLFFVRICCNACIFFVFV